MPDNRKLRTWQEIAEEASHERDPNRVAELTKRAGAVSRRTRQEAGAECPTAINERLFWPVEVQGD